MDKPVKLIPTPSVAGYQKTKKADSVRDKRAEILLKESDIEHFWELIGNLIDDEAKQLSLGRNIKKLALPNATNQIVDEVEKILK